MTNYSDYSKKNRELDVNLYNKLSEAKGSEEITKAYVEHGKTIAAKREGSLYDTLATWFQQKIDQDPASQFAKTFKKPLENYFKNRTIRYIKKTNREFLITFLKEAGRTPAQIKKELRTIEKTVHLGLVIFGKENPILAKQFAISKEKQLTIVNLTIEKSEELMQMHYTFNLLQGIKEQGTQHWAFTVFPDTAKVLQKQFAKRDINHKTYQEFQKIGDGQALVNLTAAFDAHLKKDEWEGKENLRHQLFANILNVYGMNNAQDINAQDINNVGKQNAFLDFLGNNRELLPSLVNLLPSEPAPTNEQVHQAIEGLRGLNNRYRDPSLVAQILNFDAEATNTPDISKLLESKERGFVQKSMNELDTALKEPTMQGEIRELLKYEALSTDVDIQQLSGIYKEVTAKLNIATAYNDCRKSALSRGETFHLDRLFKQLISSSDSIDSKTLETITQRLDMIQQTVASFQLHGLDEWFLEDMMNEKNQFNSWSDLSEFKLNKVLGKAIIIKDQLSNDLMAMLSMNDGVHTQISKAGPEELDRLETKLNSSSVPLQEGQLIESKGSLQDMLSDVVDGMKTNYFSKTMALDQIEKRRERIIQDKLDAKTDQLKQAEERLEAAKKEHTIALGIKNEKENELKQLPQSVSRIQSNNLQFVKSLQECAKDPTEDNCLKARSMIEQEMTNLDKQIRPLDKSLQNAFKTPPQTREACLKLQEDYIKLIRENNVAKQIMSKQEDKNRIPTLTQLNNLIGLNVPLIRENPQAVATLKNLMQQLPIIDQQMKLVELKDAKRVLEEVNNEFLSATSFQMTLEMFPNLSQGVIKETEATIKTLNDELKTLENEMIAFKKKESDE